MEILKKKTAHIKDHDHVKEVISQLIKGGAPELQIISDFDNTISRTHLDGAKCDTSYEILEKSSCSTDDYKYQSKCLFDFYYPIELDRNLTKAEKAPYMIEWSTKALNLMPASGITKDDLQAMVETSNLHLRDGCDVMFELLYKHNVPFLIISAGVGDIMEEVLRQQKLLYSNVKVISNFLQFNDQNKLEGFKGSLIHPFNKKLCSIENGDYFHHLKSRRNNVLLGDSLGDPDMAEGLESHDCILKIGYLNHKIEEFLPEYLDAYDIVLADDQTMDVPHGILQSIL